MKQVKGLRQFDCIYYNPSLMLKTGNNKYHISLFTSVMSDVLNIKLLFLTMAPPNT